MDNNDELVKLMKDLTILNSQKVSEFENNIDRTLGKTVKAFEEMIDSGILAQDPENMVSALKVLVTAKRDIANTKRQLIETTMRGLAVNKAVTEKKPMSALDKYYERHALEGVKTEDTASNGMFGAIES